MNKTTVDDAVVVQVFKTGEKGAGLWSRRGRKPQGYNVYIHGVLRAFIPYAVIIERTPPVDVDTMIYGKWLVK